MSDLHALLLAKIDEYTTSAVEDGYPVAAPFAALRTVVELHAPFHRSMLTLACRACSTPVHTQPGRYATVINWPCSTIQVIAEQLGVPVARGGV